MISVKNVRVHNLKSVSLTIPTGQLICFTGVSGSGKSSMAFDTIYVEGQRRYVESLSQHARRLLQDLVKPDLDAISGISPTISIEQKTAGKNPRSTVGTITEVYDYLRVLYARLATAYCPVSHEPVVAQSQEAIIKAIKTRYSNTKIILLAPYLKAKKGELHDEIEAITKRGFTRIRIDNKIVSIDTDLSLDKNVAHDLDIVVDRLHVIEEENNRLLESITVALELGNGSAIVIDSHDHEELFSTRAFSPKSGLSYEATDPQDFSFNSPTGMCPDCHGMGIKQEYILEKIIDPEKSIRDDCCAIASSYTTVRYGNIYNNLAHLYNFNVKTPWKNLSDSAKHVFLYGTERKWTRMTFVHPVTKQRWQDTIAWRGVLHEAYDKYQKAKSESYKRNQETLMHLTTCPSCKGARIKPFPAAARFREKTIQDVTHLTIHDALTFFRDIKLQSHEVLIGQELLKEIIERLTFLQNVGLGYLQIDRSSPTLSGGEAQRVRLASQIGSGLVGITYILDEPSIGLHPQDNKKLIQSLLHLRDKNNTVIIVEHDEETIRSSDYIVDFGPKAGYLGGQVVYAGTLPGFFKNTESITSDYLTGRKKIPIPKTRRQSSKKPLTITGATLHNLKNVTLELPLGMFIAITGVSGSGKSSLFLETLYPALANTLHASTLPSGNFQKLSHQGIDKVIQIDQSPIGRTPRSNPATYVGVFDDIRDLFTKLPLSQSRGYKAGRFSFNVKEGSCSSCHGLGMVKIDMDFLEESWVECPECYGMRFDEETLSVRYKEKNIRDVLDMDVKEALLHFANIPSIFKKLDTLNKVGLDYIKLGQSSTTLSGGEAQRIKLARELAKSATGNTLYILDEPTTGLHFYDISHLLEVLHTLVDRGNTVAIIEHNMDLVKTADWIIDMGPGSGDAGGKIIAAGTPEQLAQQDSPTGHAIREILHKKISKKTTTKPPQKHLSKTVIKNARQNNLKDCTVEIPHEQLTVVIGPSGAGKSSLAFETVYAEGQRRYVESLSPYVRQFVKQSAKPAVDQIDGLLPTIAIEQRQHTVNPRSTVGTMTEIYDYLRILFARIGIPHSPKSGHEIRAISKELIVDKLLAYPEGEKIHIFAPLEIKRTESFIEVCKELQKQGFLRIRVNGTLYELENATIPYDPKRKNEVLLLIDRLKITPAIKIRLFEAINNAAKIGKNKVIIERDNGDVFFNLAFAVVETGESFPEITAQTFAFNTPQGMCPDCQGLGYTIGVDLQPTIVNKKLSPLSLAQELWDTNAYLALDLFEEIQESSSLSELYTGNPKQHTVKIDKVPFQISWKGFNAGTAEALKQRDIDDEFIQEMQIERREHACTTCQGSRLNSLARHVTINKTSLPQLCHMPIDEAYEFIKNLKIKAQDDLTLKQVHEELCHRLDFLNRIGLSYISLDRSAPSLSGGEAQRVRLARQIGSGLTNVMYILDEPTTGLHPQDTETLISALDTLKQTGNTLLIVEHDPQIIAHADHVIELGPGSGKAGGTVVYEGPLTKKEIPVPLAIQPSTKKKSKSTISVKNATIHNLQKLHVNIPTNEFVTITGVSGSGKSTLLFDVLYKSFLDKDDTTVKGLDQFTNCIVIDQSPMGLTARSDVASYVDVLTPLRHFFAELPQAQIKGLEPKHFSAYHRKGMCTTCFGMGYKKVYMHFLPSVKMPCPACHGLRLNPLSLSIQYQGKNIGDILQMSVSDAKTLFQNHPKIVKILDLLIMVGLGYLTLGQEMQTLSSGESQRLKLCYMLSKRTRGNTLYLFDEPTTGLHSKEIKTIIEILRKLLEKGHSVIVIEHNLDLIASSDHVIDLGPGAGLKGGKIISQGSPEEVAATSASLTGKFLRNRF